MRTGTMIPPLVKSVVTGNWREVVKIYKQNPQLHAARITISGETALHMAVSDERELTVIQLVMAVTSAGDPDRARKVLTMANERGNTPLHLAAAMGSVRMCKCIAEVDSGLIGRRNHDGETPLFLAVLNCKKEAFLCLNEFIDIQAYSYCRRKDGDTILHCAIAREYIELAYIIIHLYPDLVDWVNEDGISPLYILATKPSAFRSGSSMAGFSRFVYNCIHVDELEYTVSSQPFINHNNNSDSSQQSDMENTFGHVHPRPRGLDAASVDRQGITKCIQVMKFLFNAMFLAILLSLSFGWRQMGRVKEKKQKHTWSVQVLDALLQRSSLIKHPELLFDEEGLGLAGDDGMNERSGVDEMNVGSLERKQKPLLVAARNGITELVDKYLQLYPAAILEMNSQRQNIVLLAAENRQPQVYQLILLNLKTMKDTIFRQVDSEGNSVLHLAAKLGDYRPWLNQDAALHMQREIKWFQYVRNSVPVDSSFRLNHDGKTPEDIFIETHSELVKVAAEWLTHTSESCSFVAALVATVAFATSATIPGGVKQDIGSPALEHEPAFYVFATSSLVALCFSVTSTVLFLAILTSGFQIKDFHTSLPRKLLTGLATLCVSIIAMMVSFCSSHFFILKGKIGYGAFGIYAAMALMPVIMTVFLISKFPHSVDLMWATFTDLPLPERSNEVLLP